MTVQKSSGSLMPTMLHLGRHTNDEPPTPKLSWTPAKQTQPCMIPHEQTLALNPGPSDSTAGLLCAHHDFCSTPNPSEQPSRSSNGPLLPDGYPEIQWPTLQAPAQAPAVLHPSTLHEPSSVKMSLQRTALKRAHRAVISPAACIPMKMVETSMSRSAVAPHCPSAPSKPPSWRMHPKLQQQALGSGNQHQHDLCSGGTGGLGGQIHNNPDSSSTDLSSQEVEPAPDHSRLQHWSSWGADDPIWYAVGGDDTEGLEGRLAVIDSPIQKNYSPCHEPAVQNHVGSADPWNGEAYSQHASPDGGFANGGELKQPVPIGRAVPKCKCLHEAPVR